MKIVIRKIKDLIPAEYNPRQLREKQFEEIEKSLSKFGFVDPVIVNKKEPRENVIVGGHQRCKVWKSLGNETVPTFEVNLSLEEERELNVRLNKNTGEWDFDSLANYFEQEELIEWGFEEYELGMVEDVDLDDFFDDEEKESSDALPKIVLEYTEEEHKKVSEGLKKIAGTPENAVWKLLGYKE